MKQTAKFKLSQWDAADRILMQDFNADNLKIETALAAHAAALGAVGGDYMGQAPPDFGLIVNDIYEHGNTILPIAVWCGAPERYTVVTPPALGGGCGR